MPVVNRVKISQAAVIVAEFLGTCLWFSATAVAPDVAKSLGYGAATPLDLSSAVQIGFVTGTLTLGLTGLADRFRASRIFAASAFCGALVNALIATAPAAIGPILICRFVTGVALAGIYPIGMKLVVSWNRASAGRALSWLVATLTLGTAFPHLIRYLDTGYDWRLTILAASLLACAAALIVLATGDGPDTPATRRTRFEIAAVLTGFRRLKLGAAALGYLGHMWELYAFWSLVPLLVLTTTTHGSDHAGSLLAFLIIATGATGSVIGGLASKSIGSRPVALIALAGSAVASSVVPIVHDPLLLLVVLFAWGLFVIPDSPQLSSLAVMACRSDQVASTLALLNGAGFLLTVVSIKLTLACWPSMGQAVGWLLLPGPVVGMLALLLFDDRRTAVRQEEASGPNR
jgi:hypothetical protein